MGEFPHSAVRAWLHVSTMRLTSPAFREGERIPLQYSRDNADKSPPLAIENVPVGTRSLALIVDDPDAPGGQLLSLDRIRH